MRYAAGGTIEGSRGSFRAFPCRCLRTALGRFRALPRAIVVLESRRPNLRLAGDGKEGRTLRRHEGRRRSVMPEFAACRHSGNDLKRSSQGAEAVPFRIDGRAWGRERESKEAA